MNLLDAAALLAAGFAAGTVNAVAGGGSLITFPTLVAIGLDQRAANVTNSIAVSPGYLASAYGSRTDLAELARTRNLYALAPTAVLGSAAGCALLLLTPARAFALAVPFLVLGATGVLAFQQRLRAVVGHPRQMSPTRQKVTLHTLVAVGAAYGGYFGAALGVMLVAGLGLVMDESLARINALKNAISAVVGLTTLFAFALFGPVNWAAVAVVAPATILGGYLGARLARRLPARILRSTVVGVGAVISVYLLVRAYS
jgi:uncharacterized membrane protein YfcA